MGFAPIRFNPVCRGILKPEGRRFPGIPNDDSEASALLIDSHVRECVPAIGSRKVKGGLATALFLRLDFVTAGG